MIDIISEIRQQSRLFNEPASTPAPTHETLARELDDVIDGLREMRERLGQECQRIENRLVLVREKMARVKGVGL